YAPDYVRRLRNGTRGMYEIRGYKRGKCSKQNISFNGEHKGMLIVIIWEPAQSHLILRSQSGGKVALTNGSHKPGKPRTVTGQRHWNAFARGFVPKQN